MSASSETEPQRSEASNTEASDAVAVPESHLQRMDPDSILADEANPDEVLGQESSTDTAHKRTTDSNGQSQEDEEAAALKRASAASAIFSHDHSSRPASQSLASENGLNHS